MSRTSSKVQCAKCQSFDHITLNCTIKYLVIQEYTNVHKQKDYRNQVYDPNPKNFSDMDEDDVEEK